MTRASDTARILSGGAVINEDSNDVDFRVESNGNANMLVVDGGNDNVGISNSAPPSTLTIGDGTANLSPFDLAAANSGQDAIFLIVIVKVHPLVQKVILLVLVQWMDILIVTLQYALCKLLQIETKLD